MKILRPTPLAGLRAGLLVIVAALGLASAQTGSASLEDVKAQGFSVDRLARIREMVDQRIEEKLIPGAVAAVARNGKIVYFEARGCSDVEKRQPLAADASFRVASMSKPVTAVGIMILVEEGKVRLTDPVARFIPEFHGMSVALPGTKDAAPAKAGTQVTPARRDITVRDLLTHTSGVGSGPLSHDAIVRIERRPEDVLADYVPKLGRTPLEFEPGSRWAYSGQAGFDILGRIIEIASGESLEAFLQRRLFRPLKMTSTTFHPTPLQKEKLPVLYTPGTTGIVRAPAGTDFIRDVYTSGAAGLVSSTGDYLRFAMMLASGGELDGVRILSPSAMRLMGSELIPDSLSGRKPGEGWGLGMRVVAATGNATLLTPGSFGWSGAFSTHFWADPREGIAAVFMTQVAKAGGAGAETARAFETAVMQSVVRLNTDTPRH